jgi:hypothetical protein
VMHGHEKSDSATVAKKLPNKAGQPAAEAAERKAGTKGNTGQQRTRRTQIRESVSQALERVRIAARQRKKEKFTALLHHISVETPPGVSERPGQGRPVHLSGGPCRRNPVPKLMRINSAGSASAVEMH